MSRHEQESVDSMLIGFAFHTQVNQIESSNIKLNFGRYQFKFYKERRMTKNN